MGIFPCIAALFLVKRLQKVYKSTPIYAKWSNQFNLSIVLFILFYGNLKAQQPQQIQQPYQLDSVNGVTYLSEGWKYHGGDNQVWASPSYNDSGWQPIKLGRIAAQSLIQNNDIGWLRKTINIGPKLIDNIFTAGILQLGASEIYLDGKLLAKFGIVSKEYGKEKTYISNFESFPVKFDTVGKHTFAIRYSLNRHNFYDAKSLFFDIAIAEQAVWWKTTNWDIAYNITIPTLLFGVFLILFILHLALFFLYKINKANFYFSLYSLFICLAVSSYPLTTIFNTCNAVFFLSYLFLFGLPLGFLFYVIAVYQLFKVQKGRWLKFLGLLFFIDIFLEFFVTIYIKGYSLHRIFFYGFMVLLLIEVIRISIISTKNKVLNAKIFFKGQIISLVCFVPYIIDKFIFVGNDVWKSIYLITIIIGFLIPSIIISIILGRDFAATNMLLNQQLNQVKLLSKEKEELLAGQNEMLEKEVAFRTEELNKSLGNLKAAQKQLVQSEKLASLGELTAGIAHEIQNPLNFVNNFSEVSIELLDEMAQELNNGDKDEAIAIAGDIKQNLAIIHNHGKRADFIVKGMLQHSRASNGERQPTNINILADEFLKLSFHGLRKDKFFNTELIIHFDENLPKLNVVQQDIGRVLLNIFNNALYAVQQKQKLVGNDFKPEVSVQTLVGKGFVLIKIKDNGIGMPDNIKEKIMQPFFTTKPAGEGTGLGLSLSYDIIVKGHGGNISVDSKQGEGSEFIVSLPIN